MCGLSPPPTATWNRIFCLNIRIGHIIGISFFGATNRNLEQDILSDRFRSDLFYRLNVFPIYLPPLRERGSDVILLADHFLLKYSKEMGKRVKRISTAAIEAFLSHKWPGNVRELENCMERAVLLTKTETVDCMHLPPSVQVREKDADRKEQSKLSSLVEAQEKTLIIEALEEAKGNQTKAARILGTTKRIIQYKISKMGIDPKIFKASHK
jgi:Nif-specific regulatory protein